jgi:hypothetical protein
MKVKIFPVIEEMHCSGSISIESIPESTVHGDLGIQIARDGRVWICVNGIAVLRFKPCISTEQKEAAKMAEGIVLKDKKAQWKQFMKPVKYKPVEKTDERENNYDTKEL